MNNTDPWKDKNLKELEEFVKTMIYITSTNNLEELKELIEKELEKRKKWNTVIYADKMKK